MGYTWDEVMDEKLPRTLYTFERLQIEGEKKRERRKEMEQEAEQAKNHG